jgi:hypothetical protein
MQELSQKNYYTKEIFLVYTRNLEWQKLVLTCPIKLHGTLKEARQMPQLKMTGHAVELRSKKLNS